MDYTGVLAIVSLVALAIVSLVALICDVLVFLTVHSSSLVDRYHYSLLSHVCCLDATRQGFNLAYTFLTPSEAGECILWHSHTVLEFACYFLILVVVLRWDAPAGWCSRAEKDVLWISYFVALLALLAGIPLCKRGWLVFPVIALCEYVFCSAVCLIVWCRKREPYDAMPPKIAAVGLLPWLPHYFLGFLNFAFGVEITVLSFVCVLLGTSTGVLFLWLCVRREAAALGPEDGCCGGGSSDD